MEAQNDMIARLKQYVKRLDERIAQEKRGLKFVYPKLDPKYNDPFEQLDAGRAVGEPIIRTIIAYENSKETLYELFPELKEEQTQETSTTQ